MQNGRSILWVSYGYVMGILWGRKVVGRIYNVAPPMENSVRPFNRQTKKSHFLQFFPHMLAYVGFFLYLCSRFLYYVYDKQDDGADTGGTNAVRLLPR